MGRNWRERVIIGLGCRTQGISIGVLYSFLAYLRFVETEKLQAVTMDGWMDGWNDGWMGDRLMGDRLIDDGVVVDLMTVMIMRRKKEIDDGWF